MNPSAFKDIVNSRGYKYHYYAVPAKGKNFTILFVHGFPQNSKDWRFVAPFFEEKGYGVIAPDMLAYGGSDKPTDWREYQYSLLTKDLADILDAEGVQQAIAVGHDWGSGIVSRLCNFYPDRFLAYAFMNVPYVVPNSDPDIDAFVALTSKIGGYEQYGYWYFFGAEGSDKLIEEHIDAFVNTLFARDSSDLIDAFCKSGALKNSLLTEHRTELAPFMQGGGKQAFIDSFKDGFAAALCYYQIMVNNGRGIDDATIPEERRVPPVSSPLFYGAALKDTVCRPEIGKAVMSQEMFKNHNVTIKDFHGDHWLMMYPELAQAVRRELLAWIESTVAPTVKARV